MREIKFRAWDKKYGMMDSDFYMHSSGSQYDLAARNYNTPHIEIEKTELELMQYTGLKDKNGVEIYEGDIVRVTGGVFHQGFREIDRIVKVDNIYDLYMPWYDDVEIEILGNIYENPELLEVQNG